MRVSAERTAVIAYHGYLANVSTHQVHQAHIVYQLVVTSERWEGWFSERTLKDVTQNDLPICLDW